MGNENGRKFIEKRYWPLLDIAEEARACVNQLLEIFNKRRIRLFDLSAGRRIFLFILTRSIKTYSSIIILCREGCGQDAAALLRGLLENLITAEYILYDPHHANDLASRFVAYKWIIFKRSLGEQEKALAAASMEKKKEFNRHKAEVMRHVEEFKKKFDVTSDRALVTWSGKTVRDMAKHVSPQLLAEYDETFRQCSKFSHPSILGDNEYMIRENKNLVFSPQPSGIGVVVNLRLAVRYFLDLAELVNEQLDLHSDRRIARVREAYQLIYEALKNVKETPSAPERGTVPIKECTVVFKVDHPA